MMLSMMIWTLFLGCDDSLFVPAQNDAVGGPDLTSPGTTPDTVLPPGHASVVDEGSIGVPDPALEGRGLRRMNVDQLDAAMRQVTGGIGWDDEDGVSEFENLALTLGKPDFIEATREDLTPGLLFQKFLDDAANAVCEQLVTNEASMGSGNVFLTGLDNMDDRDPAHVEDTLRDAIMRFHQRDPSAEELSTWTWLLDSTESVTGGDRQAGWRAVCIGLFTHPDFYTY